MSISDPVELVAAWHAAVNARDVDRLLALSSPAIELVGPRGIAKGHDALRGWLDRAGLTLDPQRVFARGDAVVVAAHATWRAPDTGAVIGDADVASCFRVAGDQVAQYARYDTLAEALAAGGLSDADEAATSE
jgi:ketosteroid isomerase-like protein